MSSDPWHIELDRARERMMEFGATPHLCLKNGDGSVLLAHADFDAYEGPYEKEPYLRLHLCTAHMGRLFRRDAVGATLEGVLRPGSFGITLPNTEAEGYWPRIQMLGIMISPERLSELSDDGVGLEELEPAAHVLHRDPLVSSVMFALLQDAEAHGLTSAFFDQGLTLILKRLTQFKHVRQKAEKRPVRPLTKSRLDKVLELIESRLGSDVRISELAGECGMDVRTLTRSFRASTGFAPYEYLTMRRMDHAKRLLLSDTPVTEVAFSVGYSNPSKFAAAFRRFNGVSPSQWRREQQ